MAVAPPINLHAWVEENRHLLKPPVGNKSIWSSNFLVMIVGGPNARTDYHVNPGEELFYQIEGDIVVQIMDDGKPRDIPIKQGEMFLLPSKVPHSPQRPANTIGLVVEQPKAFTDDHHLRWYCRKCGSIVYDFTFQPADIGQQIKSAIAEFNSRTDMRTCKKCGEVHSA